MEDDRLVGKPDTNDGSLPFVEYDYNKLPVITLGIWHAVRATGSDGRGGWPSILTYDHVRDSMMSRRQKRSGMDKAGVPAAAFPGTSRDEYPFASTVENAGSTFVTHAPLAEQALQAKLMHSFYRAHGVYRCDSNKPFWFEVRLINVPGGK